jgi:hypothetical protein
MVGEEGADSMAKLVAEGGPRRRDGKVPDMVRHEARARAEDRDVRAASFHELELVRLDGFADLVIADPELGHPGRERRSFDAGDLPMTPVLELLGCRRVVTMDVDDHGACLVERVHQSPNPSGRPT